MDNLDVCIVCSPGMGHVNPVLLLGNRLATLHGVRVTVFLVTSTLWPPESKLLKLPFHPLLHIHELPPVDRFDSSAKVVTQLCQVVRSAMPSLRSAVAAMEPRPHALFVDHFCTEALPIAAEFNISKYVYVPSNALFVALLVYSPILDQQILGEFADQTEPIQIPGCKPIRAQDLVDPMLDQKDEQYQEYLKMGRSVPSFDGILINSWPDVDPNNLRALRSIINIPVHPVGPLTRKVEPGNNDSDVVRWLDRQPKESVVFVSFGSGGTLSEEEVRELAWGLEQSRQRFVWVVRRPTQGAADDAFFRVTDSCDDGTPEYLPQGFLTRTQEQGLLVSNWAPQAEILSHPAVGGFLSHCGWNSTLESIANGVPMIAWPLYAEQKMNAALLAEDVGVAVRLPVLERKEIESVVRALIEGEEGRRLRGRAKQLKISAAQALQLGGPSHSSMCDLLANIKASTNVPK